MVVKRGSVFRWLGASTRSCTAQELYLVLRTVNDDRDICFRSDNGSVSVYPMDDQNIEWVSDTQQTDRIAELTERVAELEAVLSTEWDCLHEELYVNDGICYKLTHQQRMAEIKAALAARSEGGE